MSTTHKPVTEALKQHTEHFFCVSIKDGQIFHDVSVEGFENKVAMIEEIEKLLERLKS
jgi:hypothetical protein